ncbi:MAG TPA: hypothetical protein VGP45_10355, partial [Marinobacter sp.]|nr:hypothetical protein [Marinobacter sp.]
MSEQLPLTPMVYVCVASGHTLPLYEACLARRPSHIVLIVSRWASEHAMRLVAQLERALPDAQLHQPGENDSANRLAGDSLENDTAWVRGVLKPFLKEARFSGLPRWLNLNGGTKLMSLILSSTLHWDRLDYRATQESLLRASHIELNGDGFPAPLAPVPEDNCSIPAGITPFDVARLYNVNVRQLSPNPLRLQKSSIPLAEKMFVGIAREQPGLIHILSVLDDLWSRHRGEPAYSGKEISMPLATFLPQQAEARRQAKTWLHALEQLCPGGLQIS